MRLVLAAQILMTGPLYHAEDVPAKPAGAWLALYGGARPRLEAVKVQAARVRDPITDEEKEPPTGWQIAAPGQPLLLLRDAPALKAGPVAAAAVEPGPPMRKARAVKLGAHAWRLEPAGVKRQEGWLNDGKLVLTDGKIRQTLVDLGGKGDVRLDTWTVDWAGDLDRDGKPDLVLSAPWHYSQARMFVFLSGGAKPGQLVREAASWEFGGE